MLSITSQKLVDLYSIQDMGLSNDDSVESIVNHIVEKKNNKIILANLG